MAHPTPSKYARAFSFTGAQSANPNNSPPGVKVDVELDEISIALGGTIDALADVRKADGTIADGVVGPGAVTASFLAAITQTAATAGAAAAIPGPAGPPGPAGTPGLPASNYAAPGTGSVSRPLSDKLFDGPINVLDFIPVALQAGIKSRAGVADLRTYIQAAINYAQTLNGALFFPPGRYVMSANAGGYCLLITNPLTMYAIPGSAYLEAAGASDTVGVTTAVGGGVNTIAIIPGIACSFLTLDGLTFGSANNGVRYGYAAVYMPIIANRNLGNFTMRRCLVMGGSGPALIHDNAAGANTNGGMYCSLIEENVLQGGQVGTGIITLNYVGDSNTIRHNIITGTGVGIVSNNVAGASLLVIDDNNITASGGAILHDGGSRLKVIDNNIEQTFANGTTNGAMVDLNGLISTSSSPMIANNHMGALAAGVTSHVRIRNTVGGRVEQNTFTTTTGTQNCIDVDTSDETIIGRNTSGQNGGTITAMVTEGASSSGIMGVRKALAGLLVNSWVAATSYAAPAFHKDQEGRVTLSGSISGGTQGTTICTLPVGFRPIGTVAFACSGTAAGSLITVNSSGVVTAVVSDTVRLDLNTIIFDTSELGNPTSGL